MGASWTGEKSNPSVCQSAVCSIKVSFSAGHLAGVACGRHVCVHSRPLLPFRPAFPLVLLFEREMSTKDASAPSWSNETVFVSDIRTNTAQHTELIPEAGTRCIIYGSVVQLLFTSPRCHFSPRHALPHTNVWLRMVFAVRQQQHSKNNHRFHRFMAKKNKSKQNPCGEMLYPARFKGK